MEFRIEYLTVWSTDPNSGLNFEGYQHFYIASTFLKLVTSGNIKAL